jgi:hypothetical protein
LYYALQRVTEAAALLPAPKAGFFRSHEIQSFIENYVSVSCEGETCVTAIGALWSSLTHALEGDLDVTVHPTNQAGSSSNEVSDIDVTKNGKLAYTLEVKDKKFAAQDVGHAVSKVENAGHGSLIFVVGPQGRLEGCSISDAERAYSSNTTSLIFVHLLHYSRSLLSLMPDSRPADFYKALLNHCRRAKVKDKTLEHLATCARKSGWID